ncbi:MAG: glycoside hydrolase family 15 protein [Actinomycetota bacterium]
MTQRPIEDYALIGDTRTAALCSSVGSIDWMAVPRFDSKPIFSRLVDEEGGHFTVCPMGDFQTSRSYSTGSAVLETRWRTSGGSISLREGMVVRASGDLLPQTLLVRHVSCDSGKVPLRILYSPVHGFERRKPKLGRRGAAVVCSWDALAVSLACDRDIEVTPGSEVIHTLSRGEELTLILTVADRAPLISVTPERGNELLDETESWWRQWSSSLELPDETHDAMLRSFITLRLLTYSPTAAPVAAPTTSLPESIGGSDNWDYRFSWPRDAAIGLAAFLAVGRTEEAHAFMHWLLNAARISRPRINVLYDIYGRTTGDETEADVSGYRGSRPVRIGNAAATQHQLDVYGWVLDTGYLLAKAQGSLHSETWRALSSAADFVAEHWQEPDSGIWERRGAPRHYVHSKLMGWLALDRAIKTAESLDVRDGRTERWQKERDLLADEVRERGFDEDLCSYVDSYDSHELDAALLLLPVLEFDPPDSERVQGTIRAIRDQLEVREGLVYRFSDRIGEEGVFLPCCFWLVQALARTGKHDEAKDMFDRLMEHANDVGLFAEELDPASGAHLGNFPQAFTHAALIQAGLAIGEARS